MRPLSRPAPSACSHPPRAGPESVSRTERPPSSSPRSIAITGDAIAVGGGARGSIYYRVDWRHRRCCLADDARDDTFAEVAEAASVPVVVDLWAPWYGPCRLVSRALAQVATDMAGRVKLVKVNVDHSPKTQRFSVQAIPTLMVLRHGQVVARRAGAAPAPGPRAWVEAAIRQ